MAKKRKQRAKDSVSLWKEKAWKTFSQYIRLRDRVEENGFPTNYAACITCGKVGEWKSLQAGHFIPGRHNSILFDERNCHAQCYRCNMHLGGNTTEYWPVMQERYGDDVIEELRCLDKQSKKYTYEDLKELVERYKEKIEHLENL
jgi:hypothetical protein